jgi:hypothetical protein
MSSPSRAFFDPSGCTYRGRRSYRPSTRSTSSTLAAALETSGRDSQEWSGGHIASYTGVDVEARPSRPDLIEAPPFVRLRVADSAHLDVPLEVNLLVSQSAVEHFPDDLHYFRCLRDFVAARETPVLQLHAFPSPACLELYPRHGVRQYTPRTVSLTSRLFRGSRRTLRHTWRSAQQRRVPCLRHQAALPTRPGRPPPDRDRAARDRTALGDDRGHGRRRCRPILLCPRHPDRNGGSVALEGAHSPASAAATVSSSSSRSSG